MKDIWENPDNQKKISSLMILIFLSVLGLIQLNRMDFLPVFMRNRISLNHINAIDFAFNLLLIKEIFDMILFLPRSISSAQRKQLQILSLILLRFAFKELSFMGDPITVTTDPESIKPILEIMAAGASGLLVFMMVHFFYKLENKPMLVDLEQRNCFIAEKKTIALVLTGAFLLIGIYNFKEILLNRNLESSLEIFFTIFIFADILTVLIAMRYSQLFLSLFRNSGFALATVIVRISITAPPYYRELLAIFAALFSYSIAYVYNKSIINETIFRQPYKKGTKS